MKKSYPGVSAERVECTPEETIRLQEMNDSEMLEFLHVTKHPPDPSKTRSSNYGKYMEDMQYNIIR